MKSRYCYQYGLVGSLFGLGLAIASCGSESTTTALAPTPATSTNASVASESTIAEPTTASATSLLFFPDDAEGETTLLDAALSLAALNLPQSALRSSTVASAATQLSGITNTRPRSIDPPITAGNLFPLVDFADPTSVFDLRDPAVLLVATIVPPNSDLATLASATDALLGTQDTNVLRLPGENLPVAAAALEFIDVPDTLGLGETLPGTIALTIDPSIAPISTIRTIVTPPTFVPDRPPEPAIDRVGAGVLRDDPSNCAPTDSTCDVPAADIVAFQPNGAIPAFGAYEVEVELLDISGEEITSNSITITLIP
ncbi:MAG: hypothetical protein AAF704_07045 [Cyanobacteria bacterium P01_D01_bin.123]